MKQKLKIKKTESKNVAIVECDEREKPYGPNPDEALDILKCGNGDFVEQTKNSSKVWIDVDVRPDPECKGEQHPIAVIVGCADSRVPPEIIFSQGIGNLFVIRSAGNTIGAAAMGSIEYAVHVLKTPLIVVMGHQCCGAVSAAVEAWGGRIDDYEGSMSSFIEPILPAVIAADKAGKKGSKRNGLLRASIDANVSRLVNRLRNSSEPILLCPIAAGRLRIVGARYDLNGKVDFIDEGQPAALMLQSATA